MSTPNLSQSGKLYQERRLPEDRLTRRRPGPRMDVDANLARHIPLTAPLPLPELLQEVVAMPPDSGLTEAWPHGKQERI